MESPSEGLLDGQRWIFVEDSEFLPAHGGGEREHLGMLRAARDAGILAGMVLPVTAPLDRGPYEHEFPGLPIVEVRRHTGPSRLLHPRYPYTVATRLPGADLLARVRDRMADASAVIVTSYKSWVIGRTLAEGLAIPAVVRMHNREGAYHRSLSKGSDWPRSWVLWWEAIRIERDERRLPSAAWVNGVADISRTDAAWRRSQGGGRVEQVPPFAVRLNETVPVREPSDVPFVLFVGAMDVATNTDAAAWLVEQVWPRVLAVVPDARLQLVGRAPSPRVTAIASHAPHVELHADVPEVSVYLRRSTVAVNPAISGSGVNIKLVEYLAAGIPVVSTSHATRGLELSAGQDLLIADDPEGFASCVIEVLTNSQRATALGLNGQRAIRSFMNDRANLEKIAALLQPVAR